MRAIRGNEIGMIFQEPMTALNPVFTVERQLTEGLRLHRGLGKAAARARALELMAEVRIPEPERRLRQYPHELSGGMRQRVMIAMALACAPRLLIADEPTTALDVTIQAEILALINRLKRETGAAVIFITHDMAVVAQMADRVVVMRRGRKVEEGPVERIFESPEHDYTKELLAAVPRLGEMRGKPHPEPMPLPGAARAAAAPLKGGDAPLLEVGGAGDALSGQGRHAAPDHRQRPCGGGRLLHHQPGEHLLAGRRIGLRQVHGGPLGAAAHRAAARNRHPRRRGRHRARRSRPAPGAGGHADGVSGSVREPQSDNAPDRPGLRAAAQFRRRVPLPRSPIAAPRSSTGWSCRADFCAAIRTNSRAASARGWRSRGRWR